MASHSGIKKLQAVKLSKNVKNLAFNKDSVERTRVKNRLFGFIKTIILSDE